MQCSFIYINESVIMVFKVPQKLRGAGSISNLLVKAPSIYLPYPSIYHPYPSLYLSIHLCLPIHPSSIRPPISCIISSGTVMFDNHREVKFGFVQSTSTVPEMCPQRRLWHSGHTIRSSSYPSLLLLLSSPFSFSSPSILPFSSPVDVNENV